jgi:hypothetical protein
MTAAIKHQHILAIIIMGDMSSIDSIIVINHTAVILWACTTSSPPAASPPKSACCHVMAVLSACLLLLACRPCLPQPQPGLHRLSPPLPPLYAACLLFTAHCLPCGCHVITLLCAHCHIYAKQGASPKPVRHQHHLSLASLCQSGTTGHQIIKHTSLSTDSTSFMCYHAILANKLTTVKLIK